MALSLNSKSNIFEVGAFDAKTYFSELLRKVQDGAVINILKNGKQVAVLQGKNSLRNDEAYKAHQRILARSKRMAESFESGKNNGIEIVKKIDLEEIRELKNEGRKY